MRERIEALKFLLEHRGNCNGRKCSGCFFRNERGCQITESYRMEQENLTNALKRNYKSSFVRIKYEYANLYFNQKIIQEYTAPAYKNERTSKFKFIATK